MKLRSMILTALLAVAILTVAAVRFSAARPESATPEDSADAAMAAQGNRPAEPVPFMSTDFEACDAPGSLANPSPEPVDAEGFSRLLHGVWVGQRTLRKGQAQPASYMLIFDTEAREGMAFEERGKGVKENAFLDLLPSARPDSPTLTYFYCGGDRFGPFRDRFVKVSDQPGDGLAALRDKTGVSVSDASVFDAWVELREADYFTRPLESALRNTSFYTLAIVPVQREGMETPGVRWDMVGQYRGSPAKFVHGQPVPGIEGGYFEGTSAEANAATENLATKAQATADGTYLVGEQVVVTCFCDPTQVDPESGMPMTNFGYDKVVLGPLP